MILVRLLVLGRSFSCVSKLIIEGRYRCSFSNNYVISRYLHSRADDSILIKLIVRSMLDIACLHWVRYTEPFSFFFLIIISTVENTSEEPSIDSTLVKHDRIFLVIARVTSNSNDRVATSRELLKTQVLH
jgi:hypothetical protein